MRLRLFRRRPQPVGNPAAVLAPYGRPTFVQRHRKLMLSILIFAALFYGAAFALTTTFFLVQLAIPLVPLVLIVFWAMPDREIRESPLIEWLLFAFIAAMFVWPNYLALAIPGMPWITALRLVAFPLALIFLTTVAQSKSYRSELKDILSAAPAIWKLVAAYAALSLASVFVSGSVTFSFNKFSVAMLYWIMIFFVAAKVFVRPGTAVKLAYLLWFCVIVVCLITIPETRQGHVPWAGHVPSFLKIQDDAVNRILAGSARAATGIYRAQSTFTTPLGLAEFLAYTMPFALHLLLTEQRVRIKLAIAATLPLMVYAVFKTDSRLGMVGMFSGVLLYILFIGARRWSSDRSSLLGPATVLAFPAGAVIFFLSTFYIGRLRAKVWGNGPQSASNEARMTQLMDGIPKVLSHPWGYGFGRSAEVLGFTNGLGVLTIDTYYLSVALDLGIVGFFLFFSIFIVAIVRAMTRAYSADGEAGYLAPAAITLVNFVIIKSIFSQTDNHPLIFAVLGLIVALIYRFDRSRAGGERAAAG